MVRRHKSVWNLVFATEEVGSVLDTRSDMLHFRQNTCDLAQESIPFRTGFKIMIPFLHLGLYFMNRCTYPRSEKSCDYSIKKFTYKLLRSLLRYLLSKGVLFFGWNTEKAKSWVNFTSGHPLCPLSRVRPPFCASGGLCGRTLEERHNRR